MPTIYPKHAFNFLEAVDVDYVNENFQETVAAVFLLLTSKLLPWGAYTADLVSVHALSTVVVLLTGMGTTYF